jgi:hypothetical protein
MRMNVFTIIELVFIALVVIFAIVVKSPFMTENRCKNYVLDNRDKLIKEEIGLAIKGTDFHYYTDVTLRLLSYLPHNTDSTYQIIYWGDRNSWKWRFRLDRSIIVDIPYNRSKGKNVTLDLKILHLLKNIDYNNLF